MAQSLYLCHSAAAVSMPWRNRYIYATVQPQYQCHSAIAVSMPWRNRIINAMAQFP